MSRLCPGLRDRAQPLAHDEVILTGFAMIVDLLHQRSHQVDAESSHRPILDAAREIGRRGGERIKRPSIVLDFGGQPTVAQPQAHQDLMRLLIVVAVGDGVRDDFVEGQRHCVHVWLRNPMVLRESVQLRRPAAAVQRSDWPS